jgi:Eukaryotic aspartyl protease
MDRCVSRAAVGIGLGAILVAGCGSSWSHETDDGGPSPDGRGAMDSTAKDATDDESLHPGLVTVPLSGVAGCSDYTAHVAIGPVAQFELTVDTGSTTLAVAGVSCTDCLEVSPRYGPGSSAVDEHQSASASYAGGWAWTGEIYEDSVSMGTPSASTRVKLAAIDRLTGDYFDFVIPPACGPSGTVYSSQGTIGLAPGSDAVNGTNGFFDQFLAAYGGQNVFATELCDTGGTLWLGGYDATEIVAAPQYTSLSASACDIVAYAVDLEQVAVEGTFVPVPTSGYPETVVDTGTSTLVLQPEAFSSVTGAIAASAGFQAVFGSLGAHFFSSRRNCVTLTQTQADLDATLPSMTLVFGKTDSISVSASATESYLFSPEPGRWCPALYSSVPTADTFPFAAVVGATMMRSSVVIFDRGRSRLGFAPHKPCHT